ncbi:IKI3 domain-containing protein [Rozella allomycis CSF55]|uniref:Elongator complex protein 1 n=1 Tax=Rozella allomycis (strain CSF55) TaxID=988480 RepID=A0A075AYG8_ROZAC|nr:IKI3 domain-containing protein [Rozella allomycis CSF55]|eukprot:EPZ33762.1 IKI3 domain-containing protein [Rozella allomycis CSF55]
MKNLRVCSTTFESFEGSVSEGFIVYTYDKNASYLYRESDGWYLLDKGGRIKLELPNESIVSARYLYLKESVWVCFVGGEMYLVNSGYESEFVGKIEGGIRCGSTSPDSEIIAVVSGDYLMIVMNCEFDVIVEKSVLDEEEKDAFVQLGWGRKETQFHGRAGKEAAVEKRESVDGSVSEEDDGRVRISWRGDGEYFCVSLIEPVRVKRSLRVFDREGNLRNKSEDVKYLEHSLGWKPNGSLIASTQNTPKGKQVVFFERNGLRHGEFVLRDDYSVCEIEWNNDSSLLLLVCAKEAEFKLKIYGSSNYYWYLKQEVKIDGRIMDVKFSVEDKNVLNILTDKGIEMIEFEEKYFSVESRVFVIDGKRLLETDYAKANIPPPFSQIEYEMRDVVKCVEFNENVFVILQDQTLVNCVTKEEIFRFEGCEINCFSVLSKDEFLLFDSRKKELIYFNRIDLIKVGMKQDILNFKGEYFQTKQSVNKVRVRRERGVEREGGVKGEASMEVEGEASIEVDGTASVEESSNVQVVSIQIVYECNFRIDDFFIKDEKVILKNKGKIFIGDFLLIENIRQIFSTRDYLIFITFENELIFYDFNEDFYEFEDKLKIENEMRKRLVEKGAMIVCYINDGLVLQMPRGNLETIYPRSIVILAIQNEIKNKNYLKAFEMCRRHRIDLNYLVDYQDIDLNLFSTQITKTEYLNLFISNLKNDKSSLQKYSFQNEDLSDPEKINRICSKLMVLLNDKTECILTCLVKLNRIEDALKLILKHENNSREKMIEYLVFLVNVDFLFNLALGIYNLELVLLVAKFSQKDPKEYLPFLNKIKSIQDSNLQKFHIDDHLKKHKKALSHLFSYFESSNDFSLFQNYTKSHNLFLDAINLSQNHPNLLNSILIDYANSTSGSIDSANAFFLSNEISQSIDQFVNMGCYKEALILASSKDQEKSICAKSIPILLDQHRKVEAAYLSLDYLNDVDSCILYLSQENKWMDSWRIAKSKNRLDLIETIVHPSIIASFDSFIEQINELKENFIKKSNRIEIIRNKKESNVEGIEFLPDTASMITGLTISQITNSTRRTAKSRRKELRQRLRGREGTPYEEEYILLTIKGYFEKFNDLKPQISSLSRCLLFINHREKSTSLENAFLSLGNLLNEKRNALFVHPNNPIPKPEDKKPIDVPKELNNEWNSKVISSF